jgi:ABC-type Fe3+/spermidine/putrescine transport system ATPase subunit
VAEFMGRTNWFTGRLTEAVGPGLWRFESDGKTVFTVAHDGGRADLAVDVAVRPERITVERVSSHGEAGSDNRLTGEVTIVEYLGADLHHWVRLPSGERVLAVEKNVGQPLDSAGTPIRIRFERSGCIVLPASTSRP